MDGEQPAAEQDDRCRHGDTGGMAPDESGGPVAKRVWSRADRFVTLVATDVVSQRRDRRVALRCVLLQGLRDDRIEVSTKRAAKPDRGGAALGRMAGHG